MLAANVLCHLWEIEEEGIDRVLDCVQGELGAQGLSIPVASASIMQWLHRVPDGPRLFRTRGGFHFQPQLEQYEKTRCKPVVAEWIKHRDPLMRVVEACRQRDLSIRALIDTRRIGRIVERHGFAAMKTASGDPCRETSCAVNPDVFALFECLIDELTTHYGIRSIELRNFDAACDSAVPTDVMQPPLIHSTAVELMRVCFCESCLQSATCTGVDAEAARRSVQMHWRRMWQGVTCSERIETLAESDPILSAYLGHRRDRHQIIIGNLAENTHAEIVLKTASYPDFLRPDNSELVRCCPIINVGFASLPPEPREWSLGLTQSERSRTDTRIEATVPAASTHDDDSALLVKSMKQLADGGVGGVTLDGLSVLNDRRLEGARQAVRFARRSSTTTT